MDLQGPTASLAMKEGIALFRDIHRGCCRHQLNSSIQNVVCTDLNNGSSGTQMWIIRLKSADRQAQQLDHHILLLLLE